MFGLYPRKGVIAPGSDADIVLYDPAGSTVLGVATHHMNMDYSAYEGIPVAGAVRTVLSRGTRVIDAGQFRGRAGHGQYLPRGLSSYLRLPVSLSCFPCAFLAFFWRCQQWNSASSCRLPHLRPRWWSTHARRN
jgi:hypothetical protein